MVHLGAACFESCTRSSRKSLVVVRRLFDFVAPLFSFLLSVLGWAVLPISEQALVSDAEIGIVCRMYCCCIRKMYERASRL